MKKYLKFNLIFLLSAVVFIGIIALINAKIDNYGVFRSDFSKQIIEPNQNFAKMKYILSNKNKFDSFVFGSSRVGKINPTIIPDGKYYNFTYADGLPQEHLKNIKILLKNKVKIKNILLGLDDFSYRLYPDEHKNDLLKMPYPENIFEKTVFYTNYLIRLPKNYNTEKYKQADVIFDIYNTGRPVCRDCDEIIDKNPKEHLKNRFTTPTHMENKDVYLPESIDAIKEIFNICQKNGIKLTVFINPINQVTYNYQNLNNFNHFKKELAKITNYWDFSGLNKITTNNLMFYETSHYRSKVGDIIINKIFKDGTKSQNCSAFGVYISKTDVNKHLSCLTNQFSEK